MNLLVFTNQTMRLPVKLKCHTIAEDLKVWMNWALHVMQLVLFARLTCMLKLQFSWIKKGCNLLVEKPLCTSSTEAEEILAQAIKQQVIVQVGHIEHYNPVMDFLEKAVVSPKYLTVDRLAPFQPRGTEVGVVLDLMIHDIGIAIALVASPIKTIDAIGVRVLSRTEDIANARIVFENGCVANLNASRVSEKKST